MKHAYLFEAKSIQSYIFATNRLKEIVGASELIESIASDTGLLMTTVKSLSLKLTFSRRGGGAFYAFGDEQNISTLKTVWSLLIRQYAPDLEFSHAYATGSNENNAFEKANKLLLLDQNNPKCRLPSAGTFAKRCQRTGDVATDIIYKGGESETIDAMTHRKLDFKNSNHLAKRFDKQSNNDNWPINLTPEEGEASKNFPFIQGSQVALVHADGNGLGQLFKYLTDAVEKETLPADAFIEVFQQFSKAISTATENAAQEAVDSVLKPHMKNNLYPARPIVLGGDDLTIIVRADLAIPFTQAFLVAFKQCSEKAFQSLQQYNIPNLPKRLTACAGVVYAKASQPFYLMHDLAEGLCTHAKTKAKAQGFDETPSTVSFYRVTTSLTETYQNILTTEMTDGNLRQTLEAYALDEDKKLPVLQDLLDLQAVLEKPEVSKGATRQLLGLVSQSPEQASRRYSRWREVMLDANDKRPLFEEYEKRVNKLLLSFNNGKAFAADIFNQATITATSNLAYTPFEDVNTLIAVNNNVVSKTKNQSEEVSCHIS